MTDDSPSGLFIWCPWCKEFIAEHSAGGVAEANLHADQHADVAPTAPEMEETYVLAPRYEPGDRVRDVDQAPGERGTAVVLAGYEDSNADDIAIEKLGKTVADVNPGHPKKAPVYTVAFEAWLDAHVDGWKDHTGDLLEFVRTFTNNWDITLQTYDYPATRLTPRPTCDGCGARLEWVESVQGYICPNTKYISPEPTCNHGDYGPPIPAVLEFGGQYNPATHGDPKRLDAPVSFMGTGACTVCEGKGSIDAHPEPMECPNCHGSGWERGEP